MWTLFAIIILLVLAFSMDLAIVFKSPVQSPTVNRRISPFKDFADWVSWILWIQIIIGVIALIAAMILNHWSVTIALALILLSALALYSIHYLYAGALYSLLSPNKKEDPQK